MCLLPALLLLFSFAYAKDLPSSANSDPVYKELRELAPKESLAVENLRLTRDAGVFDLRSGTISFAPPVQGRVTLAVFVGDGQFTLEPSTPLARNYLKTLTKKEAVLEPFEQAVFFFTDDTYKEIQAGRKSIALEPRAADVLKSVRNRLRESVETPHSMIEAMLASGDVENIDAEVLAGLYNPSRPGMFNAFLRGKKYSDLRFFLRPWGTVPDLSAPEEVALINVNPGNDEEGVLYLDHLRSEPRTGPAEEKRFIRAEAYQIESEINGTHLAGRTKIHFQSVTGGDRVLRFGLLPTLRVSKVMAGEREIGFIQEDRKQDCAFYAILPEPLAKGNSYDLAISYEGDKVIHNAGGGNYYVGARTSWYPNVNTFRDHAKFDLTFKCPKNVTLVSVGKLVNESKEGNQVVSHWASDIPLVVAGFNYGKFKKKEVQDPKTSYTLEGYATSEVPDYLRSAPAPSTLDRSSVHDSGPLGVEMSPSRLIDQALAQAQNAIRIYNFYFGGTPYGRIAVTQQPDFNFGQSWPTLVYLPMSAFLDSTQRWQLMGHISSGLNAFVDEVTAHEVAHQWWGHLVCWDSFHDVWLSEGFATFSAGLYLQSTEHTPDKYLKYWDHAREHLVEKNTFGRRVIDAGPISLGELVNTPKNPAYSTLIYEKGGYVLHMLRYLMQDTKTGDQAFTEMMHDFVKTCSHRNATTRDFQSVVEKHMSKVMDMDQNGKMDWFFSEWVNGTEVPRYNLDYNVTPQGNEFQLKFKITQSEVGPNFKMQVPVYLDFDGKIMRLGRLAMTGNMTTQEVSLTLPKNPKRVFLNANYDVLSLK